MPWLQVLLLIAAVYVLVMVYRAVRDFIIWYSEGRAFSAEQKRFKELRRKRKSGALNVPKLKERPADSSKPPLKDPQPPPIT